MFYEEELVSPQLVEDEFAGDGPHAIGPTTLAELVEEVKSCEAQGGGEACEEMKEEVSAVAEAAGLPDPFLMLVGGEASDEAEESPMASVADPLEQLLAELTAHSETLNDLVPATVAATEEDEEEDDDEAPAVHMPAILTEDEAESVKEAEAEETVTPEAVEPEAAGSEEDEDEEEEVEVESTQESKLALARRALVQARDTLMSVIQMIEEEAGTGDSSSLRKALHSVGARVIEGVFDGERMVTGDGTIYSVPSTYASKSKLVEGDLLKLTMMPDGKLIYKQIGPTDRSRVRGVLSCDDRGGYCMLSNGTRYRLLPASVSFHRGRPGDEVVAMIPKGSPSRYAAVDLIMHQ